MAISGRTNGRRSGEQSRVLLLAAARSLFNEKGFASTSTLDIASTAGVAEKLIFRHYGGKLGLFDAVAREQIGDFMDSYVEAWLVEHPGTYTLEQVTREYVSKFLKFADANRRILIDLMGLHGSSVDQTEASPFGGLFARMDEFAQAEAARHGVPVQQSARLVRFTFGTMVSTVLLSDLWYSDIYPRPSHDQHVEQLTNFILNGGRPESRQDR